MNGKNIIFGDKKINKSNFYKSKKLFNIYEIDVDTSFKYFLGYNNDDVIRPLCIKLPQMIGYVKHFESNKTNDNRLMIYINEYRIW